MNVFNGDSDVRPMYGAGTPQNTLGPQILTYAPVGVTLIR